MGRPKGKTDQNLSLGKIKNSIELILKYKILLINVKENDEIIISEMEHHSNIVPWQMICKEKKLKLKITKTITITSKIMVLLKTSFIFILLN